jgi:TolB-like protein/DNA-binding winged helix-turn-helix (wHTH) protein/Flp pilus assembly protein TadD
MNRRRESGLGFEDCETAMTPHRAQLDEFELDLPRYELRRNGRSVKLERIPMELLILLVEHRGELVTREAIIHRLWGKGIYMETAHRIHNAVNKVRYVLREDPAEPRFLTTVVGKGYRFIGDIRVLPIPIEQDGFASETPDSNSMDLVPVENKLAPDVADRSEDSRIASPTVEGRLEESEEEISTATGHRGRSLAWYVGLAIAALLVVVLGSRRMFFVGRPTTDSLPRIQSIAVLPMDNLAKDPKQEYFVDGLTEHLITNLAQVTSLRVVSRTSIMQYKGVRRSLPDLAKSLNVDAVVEGSVLRSDGKVRITVQLLDARQDRHLWAHAYEKNEDDVIALQDEVAHDVRNQVAAELGPHSTDGQSHLALQQPPVSLPAYEDYLQGQYFWNKRTPDAAKTALEFFNRAVAAEPRYALAYAGLAETYLVIGGYRTMPQPEALMKANNAALKALELDPSLPAAHATLGQIAFSRWDWNVAELEFKRAIAQDPSYATAHHWYSVLLSTIGRHDDALHEATLAAQLDPLSPMIHANVGYVLLFSHRYPEATTSLRRVVETSPDLAGAHLWLAIAYEKQGKFTESGAEYQRTAQLAKEPERSWIQGFAYTVEGKRSDAERMLVRSEALTKQRHTPDAAVALAYINLELGKKERALDFLEKAYVARDSDLVDIKENPICDPLRANPRFQTLMRRMAFPEH